MPCKSFSTGANKLIESLQLRRHFTETTVVKEQIERCILERKKNIEVGDFRSSHSNLQENTHSEVRFE